MDSKLYNAVNFDIIDDLKQHGNALSIDQLTPTNKTVLHVACQHGSINCVKEILRVHESLLLKTDSRGETALHLAARYGHYDVVVQLLIAAAKSSLLQPHNLENSSSTIVQTLIRTQDVELETALHAAVRYNHHTVVQLLVQEDPGHEHPLNKYNETPVYLATTRGYTGIIRTILRYCDSPTFGGPHGRTALHAVVLDKDNRESMQLLLDKKKDLIKVADNYGWTVYHYVAYNDLHTVVGDLVSVDKSVGYLSDKEHKRTPLHVAAYQGKINVMFELIKHYPDSWEIADANGKNILHLAVEKDRQDVVTYILKHNFVDCNNLLIQRDNKGYTPLHLIAKSGHYYNKLMDLRAKVDWQVLDHKIFTPLDVLQMTDTEQAEQAIVRRVFNRKNVKTHWRLWRFRKNLDLEAQREKERGAEKETKRCKLVINTHMIVAALITTVGLTAVFAMPGGFDDKHGYAILRNTAYKTFLVADAVALLFSMSSLFLYFVTTLSDDSVILVNVILLCVLFNSVSVVAMMLAFITGTYAVLPHRLSNIAVTVCVISSLFIILAVSAFAKPFNYFVNAVRYSL